MVEYISDILTSNRVFKKMHANHKTPEPDIFVGHSGSGPVVHRMTWIQICFHLFIFCKDLCHNISGFKTTEMKPAIIEIHVVLLPSFWQLCFKFLALEMFKLFP